MPITGRIQKPATLHDYYTIGDIEDYEYDELHKIQAQDELSNLFDQGNLGYAKWDGNTGQPNDFIAGYFLFSLQ